jgi:hypothetical protein
MGSLSMQEWKFPQEMWWVVVRGLSLVVLLLFTRLRHVQPQARRIQIDLVAALLKELRNDSGVLEFSQANVASALLDGIADELRGAGFTLGADDRGLLFLAGLVDDESCPLSFLLGNLLGFDGSGEFRGEGKLLRRTVRRLPGLAERQDKSKRASVNLLSETHRRAGY